MKFFQEIQFVSEQQAISDVLKHLYNTKIVVLRNQVRPDSDVDFFSHLASELGDVFDVGEDLQTGTLTGNRWIDISYDPEIPDRYRTANVHQPLHTDDSYIPHDNSVTFFFSKARAPKGGATVFLDSIELIELLKLDGQEQLLEALFEVPVTFSKADSKRTRPILIKDSLGWSLNFNYFCLDDENDEQARSVVRQLHEFLENRVRNAGIPVPVMLDRGDAVFFHDQRLLHGRNAFFAQQPGDRHLQKGSVLLDIEKLESCNFDDEPVT